MSDQHETPEALAACRCGAQPRHGYMGSIGDEEGYGFVECHANRLSVVVHAETEAEAIAAWNRRTSDNAGDAVEALRNQLGPKFKHLAEEVAAVHPQPAELCPRTLDGIADKAMLDRYGMTNRHGSEWHWARRTAAIALGFEATTTPAPIALSFEAIATPKQGDEAKLREGLELAIRWLSAGDLRAEQNVHRAQRLQGILEAYEDSATLASGGGEDARSVEERARIVAWLRRQNDSAASQGMGLLVITRAADAIERGDHLKDTPDAA